MISRLSLCLLLSLPVGCAVQTPSANTQSLEVAFSPDAGSEELIVKVLGSATQSIRLAGYSFTSPAVVKGLVAAKRRGVDVKVLLDDKGNRGKANIAAMNLLAGADIPIKVVSSYAIHHDKYIVVDARHIETGSFNYSTAAAKSNSENVLVVWNNTAIAQKYLTLCGRSEWRCRADQ